MRDGECSSDFAMNQIILLYRCNNFLTIYNHRSENDLLKFNSLYTVTSYIGTHHLLWHIDKTNSKTNFPVETEYFRA